jgi:hypothetical protein
MLGGESDILDGETSALVRSWLPEPFCKAQFYKLFSTKTLGFALATFYRGHSHKRKELMKEPSVLVIKDDGGHIFGAFLSKAWHKHANRFYGTEETFVFSIQPTREFYQSSGENNNFMYSTPEMIAVGGKFNYYAFELDAELTHGKAHTCQTFDSPLLAHAENFQCSVVELWGLIDNPSLKELLGIDSDEEIDFEALRMGGPLSGKSVLNRVDANWTLDFLEGRGYSKDIGPPPSFEDEPDSDSNPQLDPNAPTPKRDRFFVSESK